MKILHAQEVFGLIRERWKNGVKLAQCLENGVYCTKNFRWSELLVNQVEVPTLIQLQALECVCNRLQALRDTVFEGTPIIITSGWRSLLHNKKVGGTAQSKHLSGEALDFTVKGWQASAVQGALRRFSGGLGSYKNFTHIDIGAERRWRG